jgi:ABC-type lipoprotein release transport system permease subunit
MILRWTLKEMRRARFRVLASAAAVAAAFTLVTVFESIWTGEVEQVVAYIENTEADVWVMQRDVNNMHMASSFVRDTKRDQVAQVEGAAQVDAILYMSTLIEAGDRGWFSYIVGVERRGQLGGPWAMTAGSDEVQPGEAIVPSVLARLSNVGLGDRITGLSEGTFSMGNPVTFVNSLDLASILTLAGYDSYILVKARPGVSAEVLAAQVRAHVEDVEVLTAREFADSDRVLGKQMGVEVIALMTIIGTSLAVLLVMFVLYIHTSRIQRELAVLKALGFRNRHLYTAVALQAIVITGLGFLLAVVLALSLQALAPALLPQLAVKVTGPVLAKVGVAGLLVATLATLVPARRVGAVDPMSVFQS